MRRRIAARDRSCRFLSLGLPGAHSSFSERPVRALSVLFVFFFSLAAAGVGWRFFEVRPLAPRPVWSPLAVSFTALALILWLAGNAGAWRRSHGA